MEGVYVDKNQSGSITPADKRQVKKSYPDWLLGLNSYTEFKDWDLSFSGRLSLGNYVYNNVNSNASYSYLYSPAGFLRNLPASANATGFNSQQYFSDYYLQNASFFRMDYICLGYSFNDLKSTNVKVRLEAAVRNAFVITKYKGQDPEVYTGIDTYTYPRCRTYSLGVEINF
jgi:TonB-dependent starch-binding outer membrane protein SusC